MLVASNKSIKGTKPDPITYKYGWPKMGYNKKWMQLWMEMEAKQLNLVWGGCTDKKAKDKTEESFKKRWGKTIDEVLKEMKQRAEKYANNTRHEV